jgi:hypothetical protein
MSCNAFYAYQRISFTLTNNSEQAIEVDWDRSSIVLPGGQTSNVMHEGTKFISAGTSTPPTTIPPGGMLSDSVTPSRNVAYADGWYIKGMNIETGSQFGLYLALGGAGTPTGYNFVFEALEVAHSQPSLDMSPAMVSLLGWAVLLAALMTLGLLSMLFGYGG